MDDHPYSVHSGNVDANLDRDMKWYKFDSVIQAFMKEQNVPGASVSIAKHGEILYTQGYGCAGASKRVQSDSVFRIASISKPITAFFTCNLFIDYPNVCLDSKIFGKMGILKQFRYKDKRVPAITIRHLLQHSAGWDRDMAGDVAFVRPASVRQCDPESVEHNHALLKYILSQKKLQFKPGSRHAYSNLCYLVLGLVIEEITKKSFCAYLTSMCDRWGIHGISIGGPWRVDWTSIEVEYFNNRNPPVVPSLHADRGDVLPQYGGLAMNSAAAYGGMVANGSSLLCFLNILDDLLQERLHNYSNIKDFDLKTFSNLMKQFFLKPDYESGLDWYGLGWDVEDNGRSWGHTGGMEGTSSILFHHSSGLSWCFLLNAWAKDIDLNGVIKCAIGLTNGLKLFDCDVLPPKELVDNLSFDGEYQNQYSALGNDDQILFSKDKSQAILIGVEELNAQIITSALNAKGYVLKWISTIGNSLNLETNKLNNDRTNVIGLSKSNRQIQRSDFKQLKYILLFSLEMNASNPQLLLLNKGQEEILSVINDQKCLGYYVTFIDSFCGLDEDLRFSAVLMKENKTNFRFINSLCDNDNYIHLGLKAKVYILHVKSWIKSYHILCQSVTEVKGELFVSVLLDPRDTIVSSNSQSTYWVQIETESFVTELSRKIKQNMTLIYSKFYNADGQAWVSGVWRSNCTSNIYHRITMSKYGLYPELASAAGENVRLLSVSEYEDDGVVYYAGLWLADNG